MGISFKMVSNQKLASLVWLKSEPSLEWLFPLWAESQLQTRGCLKPGARSRSNLRIIFFPFRFHFFLSSSLSFIPNVQTTDKLYYCFPPNVSTAWLFLMAHSSLHLLACCLALLTFTQLLLFLLLSCPQLGQSVLRTICPLETLLLRSLSTVLTTVSITGTLNPFVSYSHSTASNPHLFLLRMPWTSPLFLCSYVILISYPNLLPSSQILHYHPWVLSHKTLGNFYVCFCFDLKRCKSRQAQHLVSQFFTKRVNTCVQGQCLGWECPHNCEVFAVSVRLQPVQFLACVSTLGCL